MKNKSKLKPLAFVLTFAALGAGAYVYTNAFTGTTTTPAPTGTTVQTSRSVSEFIDSEGVVTHSTYQGYRDGNMVLATLQKLGIHNIRDGLAINGDATAMANYKLWQRNGIRFVFGMRQADPDRAIKMYNTIFNNGLQSNVIGVEGPNEWETEGGDWANQDRAAQTELCKVFTCSTTPKLNVIAPSISGVNEKDANPILGDITSIINIGNMHSYPRGVAPEASIGEHLANTRINAGTKPILTTETGYNPCLSCTTGPPNKVDDTTQAIFYPRIYLTNFNSGVIKTFMYELLNEPYVGEESQRFWGVALPGGALRPAGQSIANMNTILSRGMVGDASTKSINYKITAPAKIQRTLLSKKMADGDHYMLAVWSNDSPWDFKTRTKISVPEQPITIAFQKNVKVTKYQPINSSSAVGTIDSANTLSDTVGVEPVIYDISYASTVTPPEPPKPPTTTPGYTVDKTVVKKGANVFSKKVSLTAGEHAVYKIEVKSTGTAAVSNLKITDALPAGTTFVSGTMILNGSKLADSQANGLLSSAGIQVASLAPGAISTVQFEVAVSGKTGSSSCVSKLYTNTATTSATSLPNGSSAADIDLKCADVPNDTPDDLPLPVSPIPDIGNTTPASNIGSSKAPVPTNKVVLTAGTPEKGKEIAKVVHYVDSTPVATETQAPYSYTLKPDDATEGCHVATSVTYYKDNTKSSTVRNTCVQKPTFMSQVKEKLPWAAGSIAALALIALLGLVPLLPLQYRYTSNLAHYISNKMGLDKVSHVSAPQSPAGTPPQHAVLYENQNAATPGDVITPSDNKDQ